MAELDEIVEYLDRRLQIGEIEDYPGAHNGLQVEGRSPVEHVAAAVDACQATIEMSAEAGAQLLLVHHGLFWGDPLPVTGPTYRRLRTLFDADLALYSAHLPLDVHEELGNNVLLAEELGLEVEGRFGDHQGMEGIGVWSAVDLPLEEFVDRVERVCGAEDIVSGVTLLPGGPGHVRRVGIVTGGASDLLPQAHAAGLDTFLTGEGPHHTYHAAMELGLNVLYAGHYATETLGVKAVAAELGDAFGLSWDFLDHPTGL